MSFPRPFKVLVDRITEVTLGNAERLFSRFASLTVGKTGIRRI